MPARHVVVDGSNIATEGNSLPSLKQLDEAVREFLRENPDDIVTVVVDATFGHRIPPEERALFEEAEREGDIVSPPAGAIGRGDAFLLRIADKVGAVVLSNDSFQEFHGEHEWLFDKGRLIGGKPVPGVGWIFTPRSPVRGPKSRESVKEAKRKRRDDQGDELEGSGLEIAAERSHSKPGARKLQKAIETATEEAVVPEKAARKRRRRRGGEAPSEPVNEPLSFISFIASHRLGEEVEGLVEEFSSHGAYISAGGARCYLPLSAMGPLPPRSAREVLKKGERRSFVVQAFDPMRRGIELALPGFAHPAGTPTLETVEAEIQAGGAGHLVEARRSAKHGLEGIPHGEAGDGAAAAAGTAPGSDGARSRRRRQATVDEVGGSELAGPSARASSPPRSDGAKSRRAKVDANSLSEGAELAHQHDRQVEQAGPPSKKRARPSGQAGTPTEKTRALAGPAQPDGVAATVPAPKAATAPAAKKVSAAKTTSSASSRSRTTTAKPGPQTAEHVKEVAPPTVAAKVKAPKRGQASPPAPTPRAAASKVPEEPAPGAEDNSRARRSVAARTTSTKARRAAGPVAEEELDAGHGDGRVASGRSRARRQAGGAKAAGTEADEGAEARALGAPGSPSPAEGAAKRGPRLVVVEGALAEPVRSTGRRRPKVADTAAALSGVVPRPAGETGAQ